MCEKPVSIDDLYDDIDKGIYTNDSSNTNLQGTTYVTEGTIFLTHSYNDGTVFETSEEHKND